MHIIHFVTCHVNFMQISMVMNTKTMLQSSMTGRIPCYAGVQKSSGMFSSPDNQLWIINLARRQKSVDYYEMQCCFFLNFQCIISSPEQTVNDFCSFYFLKESLYETINLQPTYLYEHGLTAGQKQRWESVISHIQIIQDALPRNVIDSKVCSFTGLPTSANLDILPAHLFCKFYCPLKCLPYNWNIHSRPIFFP